MQIHLEKVRKFLENHSVLPKIVIIYGPTACGKTALSIELAKYSDTEIISADSRQIYRYMDIGTGKVTPKEMQGIKHYMLDIRNPDEEYSVGAYQKEIFPIISDIHSREKVPILCGGTGLYLDSVAFHFDIPPREPDWEYRDSLELLRQEKGNQYLWDMLATQDKEYAETIHPNSHHAVIRALEVWRETGKSKSELRVKKDPLFDVLFLTPYDGNREKLYERINARIEQMFQLGLIDEVKSILEKGYNPDCKGLSTIGYKEVIEYLDGKSTLDECKAKIQQGNRNYAKRQLTWFRKYNTSLD
ncbi:tRNA (adenosine(37)-N6)-dimethylallyltransferase MiaA [Candidatus Gracilibacteria bacterium]|nr:tRNA (adenosine(37)-N6)-dimethylallyltransferase MiaA [Candidatus Gracilibacteria bacterium]PIQ10796.1 MAG: tRNA (adenosine(37)-N6)-dimethylallyltransferase MiaA [Candidatus Gracilibacteria bacterium CG18_big_fil_WC_8_21_14_2_50_38_16]PIQ42068.1 MAG: tRNA (adenosine(37)-N6)-dimethylallyltransferase MiaA [Candidatus Gracilibacteria bacterium CG12_big_fil_rev_8_21_14_0_65_38_15]PIZ01876.1 MAG: tRNA (adenosine(37)-N6)-dimethylallyltransferase MiaA [Candidatus Gracilibacteria bacterium CG_4_10_14